MTEVTRSHSTLLSGLLVMLGGFSCAALGLACTDARPLPAIAGQDSARVDPDGGSGGEGAADTAAEETRFTRFVQHETPGSGVFECNLVTYRNAEQQKVILASAVHVGDASYYQKLDQLFRKQDAVLYELIADPAAVKGMKRGGGGGGGSWVSTLQRAMKSGLELEFQLDAIDYGADNFVHADLDPETFARLQEERGETIFTFLWSIMLKELARKPDPTQPDPGLQILVALFSKDRAHMLKYALAQELERMIGHLHPSEGEESVILTDRNKKAIAVLEQQLSKEHQQLCIFYGAAHMPDMEQRLLALGFEKVAEEWLPAWDMTREEPSQPESVEDSESEPEKGESGAPKGVKGG